MAVGAPAAAAAAAATMRRDLVDDVRKKEGLGFLLSLRADVLPLKGELERGRTALVGEERVRIAAAIAVTVTGEVTG